MGLQRGSSGVDALTVLGHRIHTLGLYRERWALAEICVYVAEFGRPHEETEDTRASWEELGECLG